MPLLSPKEPKTDAKLLILCCRKGGEPPRPCDRRILSPFLTSLQGAASESKKPQKPSNDAGYRGTSTLQYVAGNRGKVARQHAPKHAPDETPMPRMPSPAWRTKAARASFGDSGAPLPPSCGGLLPKPNGAGPAWRSFNTRLNSLPQARSGI